MSGEHIQPMFGCTPAQLQVQRERNLAALQQMYDKALRDGKCNGYVPAELNAMVARALRALRS